MYSLRGLLIFLSILNGSFQQNSLLRVKDLEYVNSYHNILLAIQKERPFDTILILQPTFPTTTAITGLQQQIYQFPMPKMLLSYGCGFMYRKSYNSEIIMIIIMMQSFDYQLMEMAAQMLDMRRQTRILIIAGDISNPDDFKETLLTLCHQYKMTNILLNFINSYSLYQLKPYPVYHWNDQMISMNNNSMEYYPQHWRNMHGATIITATDQTIPRSFAYTDGQGNVKLNGYVVRLILLFAEHFNATLKMYKPIKVDEVSHFLIVNQLVDENKIDIPMSLVVGNSDDPSTIRWSYTYEIAQGMLIVPCADPLNTKELFGVLLNVYFFGSLFIFTLLFSIIHSLIDYLFDEITEPSNFIFSLRIFPAVLGQSFMARNSNLYGLKIVYIFLFIAGLNIAAQFSANMNTLFTSPPRHRQIETLADIKNSPLKMTIHRNDLKLFGGILLPIVRSVIIRDNMTQYEEDRNNFNTSSGYYCNSSMWKMLLLKQQYATQNIFCTFDNMTIFRFLPFSILLQEHSQYREPLDYIIHKVHDTGLLDAWYASAFVDMLKSNKLSLRYPEAKEGIRAMTANDLYWAWMILVIGLAISAITFIVEMHYDSRVHYMD